MELLLIRHGQSHNNAVYAAQGNSRGRLPDPGLTELGHAQADQLAQALAAGDIPVRPTVLYASLMTRAIQTARPIADALDLPVHGRADAFEVSGPLDWDGDDRRAKRHHPGSPASVLRALTPRLVLPTQATESGWWSGPVEQPEDASARAGRLTAYLLGRHAGTDDVVALVSHEWFSQFLFRELLGIAQMTGWIDFTNTGVTRFVDVEGATTAAWVNRTTHLRADQLTG